MEARSCFLPAQAIAASACDKCGGRAVVKARLPVAVRTPPEALGPREVIYCPHCGIRSQPKRSAIVFHSSNSNHCPGQP